MIQGRQEAKQALTGIIVTQYGCWSSEEDFFTITETTTSQLETFFSTNRNGTVK